MVGLHGAGSTTVLEWLKTPSKRHSPSTVAETLEKIAFLKDLGASTWALESIPLEKQRGYAQALQARRPAKTREFSPASQTIELVFFLRVTLLELTDSVIYQAGRRVSDLVRQAYDKTRRGKRALQPNTAIDWCPSRRWWMTSANPLKSASQP